MKLTQIATTSSFVLALALTGPAIAAGMGEEAEYEAGSPSFSELDKDNDGYVTKEEAEGHTVIIEEWESVDVNEDDQLDTSEFSAFEAEGASEPAEPMGGATSVTE